MLPSSYSILAPTSCGAESDCRLLVGSPVGRRDGVGRRLDVGSGGKRHGRPPPGRANHTRVILARQCSPNRCLASGQFEFPVARRGGVGRANSKKDLVTPRSEVLVPYRPSDTTHAKCRRSEGTRLNARAEPSGGPGAEATWSTALACRRPAAEAEQVERTRRKTWSRARSEVFVPYYASLPTPLMRYSNCRLWPARTRCKW
jgi:hypothetical protein